MATYYIGSMPVGDSLMHYRTKGSLNGVSNTPGYKAIGNRAKGRLVNGRYVYDYDQTPAHRSGTQAVAYQLARGAKAVNRVREQSIAAQKARDRGRIMSQYNAGVRDDARARNNTDAATKAVYRTGHNSFGMNITDLGRRPQQSWYESAANDIGKKGKAAYSYASRKIKAQLNDFRKWAKGPIDWASSKVSQGLSAARTFISNILKKIGAGAKAVQMWAGQKALSAARGFGKTGLGKAIQPYVRQMTKGYSNPGQIVYNASGQAIRVGRDVYGNTTSTAYSGTGRPKVKKKDKV